MTEGNHLEISKQMQEVEKILKDLGVPLDKLDEVLGHVDNYQSLNKELQEARKKQFFNDAWNMARVKGGDKDVQIAEQLRAFAEHVLTKGIEITTEHPEMPVDEIVDLIPPMESRSPYDA